MVLIVRTKKVIFIDCLGCLKCLGQSYSDSMSYCCPNCPSCPANAIRMSRATWKIYVAMKKYSLERDKQQEIQLNISSLFIQV